MMRELCEPRERCLSFVCSLEVSDGIPSGEMFCLLKRNLKTAQMLNYVYSFNCPSWREELQFLLGSQESQTSNMTRQDLY